MSKLKEIKDFKELVGEVIYGSPTGNNSRNKKGRIEKFRVVAIGRKYVKLAMLYGEREGREDSYLPSSGATQGEVNAGYGSNAGYDFYLSKGEIEINNERESKRSDIDKYFRTWNATKKLSVLEVEAIHKIISNHK